MSISILLCCILVQVCFASKWACWFQSICGYLLYRSLFLFIRSLSLVLDNWRGARLQGRQPVVPRDSVRCRKLVVKKGSYLAPYYQCAVWMMSPQTLNLLSAAGALRLQSIDRRFLLYPCVFYSPGSPPAYHSLLLSSGSEVLPYQHLLLRH